MGGVRRSKIDPDNLRALVADGWSTTQIAELIGVTSKTITCRCNDYDIPLPGRGAGRVAPVTPVLVPAKPGPVHPPRTASLIATGGRYADLAAWAKAWGVTETKARQEWFALRLPVTKGASHG